MSDQAVLLPKWSPPGKRTAWSLIYLLNHAYYDIKPSVLFSCLPLPPNGQVGLEKVESMALLFTTISMEKNAICKNQNHTHYIFRYTAGVACDWYQIVQISKFIAWSLITDYILTLLHSAKTCGPARLLCILVPYFYLGTVHRA